MEFNKCPILISPAPNQRGETTSAPNYFSYRRLKDNIWITKVVTSNFKFRL